MSDLLPDAPLRQPTLAEMRSELMREKFMRESVYARQVKAGAMSAHQARWRQHLLDAIIANLDDQARAALKQ